MDVFEFAVQAVECTEFWNFPEDSTLKDCRVFTLSIFLVGERTHVCSLTPSSYFEEIENVFLNRDGAYLTDEQISELDRTGWQYEGLDSGYGAYVDPSQIENNPFVGEICEIEIDPDEEEEGNKLAEAWDEAREEIRANSSVYEPQFSL